MSHFDFAYSQMGVCKTKNELEDHAYYEKVWKSLDYGPPQPPPRPPQRSSSLSGESAPLAEPKVSSVCISNRINQENSFVRRIVNY